MPRFATHADDHAYPIICSGISELVRPEPRKGDWMQTAGGRAFWPLDPRPEEVFIEDIAHALASMPRYAGHCRVSDEGHHYTVAQHSILVSRHVRGSVEDRLWGLLHDASEAYVVDVPRPIKPALVGYKAIEERVMGAISRRFNMPGAAPAEVKRVDNAILADEKAALMAPEPRSWRLPEPPLGLSRDVLMPWPFRRARDIFLNEFHALVDARA